MQKIAETFKICNICFKICKIFRCGLFGRGGMGFFWLIR